MRLSEVSKQMEIDVEISRFEEYMQKKIDAGILRINDNTMRCYKTYVKAFIKNGVDSADPESVFTDIGKHCHLKRNYLWYYAMKHYFNFLVDTSEDKERKKKYKEVLDAISSGVVKPKIKDNFIKKHKRLTTVELLEILNNLKDRRDRMLFWLQVFTGARAGDILRIRTIDVDFYKEKNREGKIVNVFKLLITGKGEVSNPTIVWEETLVKEFAEYFNSRDSDKELIKDEESLVGNKLVSYDYLFLRRLRGVKQRTFSRVMLSNYWMYQRNLKRTFLKLYPILDGETFNTHDIRRYFAKRVWRKYKDIYQLKTMMNHKKVETSLLYLRGGEQKENAFYDMQTDFSDEE